MEQDLGEREAIRSAVFNATPDLVAVIDKQWTIFDVNEAMANRFGKLPEELIGKDGWDLVLPEIAESRRRHADEVFETGQPCRFEDENQGNYFDNIFYPNF